MLLKISVIIAFLTVLIGSFSFAERNLAAHEKLQNYRILDIKTKLLDRSDGYDTLSFQVTVRNLLKEKQTVALSIKALDSDGFEIESEYVTCALNTNAVEICTGQALVKTDIGKKIKKWGPK